MVCVSSCGKVVGGEGGIVGLGFACGGRRRAFAGVGLVGSLVGRCGSRGLVIWEEVWVGVWFDWLEGLLTEERSGLC